MRSIITLLIGILGALACSVVVQAEPMELKPVDEDTFAGRRVNAWMDTFKAAEHARKREEYRRTVWAEEAKRIAESKQNVVRDDDELYVNLDVPNLPRSIVLRNIWGVDPAGLYEYLFYDQNAGFHIVGISGHDLPGLYLISSRTGLVYQAFGADMPLYSPDKRRFLSRGFQGMGCTAGVALYKFENDKPFEEGFFATGCDVCSYEWLSPVEIKSTCREYGHEDRKHEHRLIHRDGKWSSTRTPAAK